MAKVEKQKYSNRETFLVKAVCARHKKVRKMVTKYKGGKYQICGYNCCIDALEFHHNNLAKKDFGISEKNYTRSWKRVVKELNKCIIIYANCHRELHAKLAASSGNTRVKSGLIQGNRNVKTTAILS